MSSSSTSGQVPSCQCMPQETSVHRPTTSMLGTPWISSATKVALLGAGEIDKEVAITLTRLGVEVMAIDRYEGAPVQQVAHNAMAVDMSDPEALTAAIRASGATVVIPEIEVLAADTLTVLESAGEVQVVPTIRAVQLTMNREGTRRLTAEELGLMTSPYAFASSLDELHAGAQQVGFPCVVKPIMSSLGHGQSVVRGPQDLEAAWRHAVADGRADRGRVIVEGFVCFDTEIALLTVCQRHPGTEETVTNFCEPIRHRQVDEDYVESWQSQSLSLAVLERTQQVAECVTTVLGGWGLFGVGPFICGEEVLFSGVSPRPHNTGLVTLASQRLNKFELHAHALLDLPMDTTLCSPGASVTIKTTGESTPGGGVRFVGPDEAPAQGGMDLRLFGKPEAHLGRRLGVVVVYADDVQVARNRAWSAARATRPSV